MKAYWGSGCIPPRILWLGTRWRRVVCVTPRPLYSQGKSPWYPSYRRMGGPQSRSERGGEGKNSQPLPGLEPRIVQPIAHRYTSYERYVSIRNCSQGFTIIHSWKVICQADWLERRRVEKSRPASLAEWVTETGGTENTVTLNFQNNPCTWGRES
jgi:hypothetical protein